MLRTIRTTNSLIYKLVKPAVKVIQKRTLSTTHTKIGTTALVSPPHQLHSLYATHESVINRLENTVLIKLLMAPDEHSFIDILSPLSENRRLEIFGQLCTKQLKVIFQSADDLATVLTLFQENNRKNILRSLISTLPTPELEKFLDKTPIAELIKMLPSCYYDLTNILKQLPEAKRFIFICRIASKDLEEIVKNAYNITYLLSLLPEKNRMSFIDRFSNLFLIEKLEKSYSLLDILKLLPKDQRLGFLKKTKNSGVNHDSLLYGHKEFLALFDENELVEHFKSFNFQPLFENWMYLRILDEMPLRLKKLIVERLGEDHFRIMGLRGDEEERVAINKFLKMLDTSPLSPRISQRERWNDLAYKYAAEERGASFTVNSVRLRTAMTENESRFTPLANNIPNYLKFFGAALLTAAVFNSIDDKRPVEKDRQFKKS